VLHGRGWFFVSLGEEAIHARKGQVGGLQRRTPWRGRVFFLNAKEEEVHLISEDHVWFEDWWMVASLCDE
jgi:hypothetical protein